MEGSWRTPVYRPTIPLFCKGCFPNWHPHDAVDPDNRRDPFDTPQPDEPETVEITEFQYRFRARFAAIKLNRGSNQILAHNKIDATSAPVPNVSDRKFKFNIEAKLFKLGGDFRVH